ncbi:MAG: N-acetyltransferase [Candidatus Hydrogenedentes bacterium]|nr:N-acetyltransferase [Candidatus Hydrogenedentota bacterium]
MKPTVEIGETTIVEEQCTIGYEYHKDAGPVRIGEHGIIRMGTIIYCDVIAGDYLQTGHHAVIRPFTQLGNYCSVFHHVVLEGLSSFGDGVRLMVGVYVPSRTTIGNHVFVGPGTMFLNDKYPCRSEAPETPRGPTIEDDVVIGGGCTIGPGIRIGRGSFIAAGTLVMKDVPEKSLVYGTPMQYRPLPPHLDRPNDRGMTEAAYDIWHPEIDLPEEAKW